MPPKRQKKPTETKTKSDESKKAPKSAKKITNKEADVLVKKDDIDLDYSIEDADQQLDEIDDTIPDDVPELTDLSKIKERYEYKPVVSQEIIILHPEQRRTSDVMTMFEYTNIISQRATQINNGAECYTDVVNLTDPIEMARKELHDKRCPLIVQRAITDKIFEHWSANELAIPIEAHVNQVK